MRIDEETRLHPDQGIARGEVRRDFRVPVYLLTGFLGAGKSTVLARLLRESPSRRLAVLVNEVGELGIDHHLLETLDGDVHLLASGCVCCTIDGALFEALDRVLRLDPEAIVIETTGIADPAPIVHGLATHPRLSTTVSLGGIVTVVDAERGELLLDEPEARAQVELADRVILTKVDLALGRAGPLRDRVALLAPHAAVEEAIHGRLPSDFFFGSGERKRMADEARARTWLHHAGARGHEFSSRTITFGGPVNEGALELWLRLVTQLDGDRLVRVKGLVEARASGEIVLLESVAHYVFPPRRLERRPSGLTESALVLIARGADDALFDRWLAFSKEAARAP